MNLTFESMRGRKVYATCRSGCKPSHKSAELPISIGTELCRVARHPLAQLPHHVLDGPSPLNHFAGGSGSFPDSRLHRLRNGVDVGELQERGGGEGVGSLLLPSVIELGQAAVG